MKHLSSKKLVQSIICLVLVALVMVAAFIFKDEIEEYAATGYFGVLVACFASTATVFLPAPGILVVIQYAQILNPFIVVLIGGLGTSLGELLGYLLGKECTEIIDINTQNKIFNLVRRHPLFMVFLFSFAPLPFFDVIGICAGMVKLNPIKFWIACLLGKTLKMTVFVLLFGVLKDFINDYVNLDVF